MAGEGVELATAYVTLIVSGEKVGPTTRKALGASEREADRSGKASGRAYSASFGSILKGTLGAVGIAELTRTAIGFAKDSFAEAREAQKVGAQTEAVIRSTGKAAGISAKQIGTLSTAISNKVGIDDEAIQSAANLVLTFRGVANEAGKGNDVFNQTVKLATDMSVALGTDARSAALQLGKALQDPTKGVTRLTRSGVIFTEQQKKQITALQKSGDLLGAQKIILREVAKEFGGSAAAQATAGDKARVAYKNLQEQIGTALLPVLNKTSQVIANDIVPAVSKFVTEMQDGTGAGGDFADVLKDTYGVVKGVVGIIDGLPSGVKKFAVEGLVAYAVLRKVNPLLEGLGTGAKTTFATLRSGQIDMDRTAASARRLGGAINTAAGAAGMVLLAKSTKDASKSTEYFDTVLGSTAVGLASGGPIGAGIGLIGSSLYKLVGAYRDAEKASKKDIFKVQIKPLADYKKAIDETTLAVNAQGRALAARDLYANGSIQTAQRLGVSSKDLIDATLGSTDAVARIQARIRELNNPNLPGGLTSALGDPSAYRDIKVVMDAIGVKIDNVREKTQKAQDQTLGYRLSLTDLPADVKTSVQAVGAQATTKQIAGLRDQYGLTPAQVKTIVTALGTTGAVKNVGNFLEAVGKVPPSKRTRVDANTKNATAVVGTFGRYLGGILAPKSVKVGVDDRAGRAKASAFKRYLDSLFGRGITQHVTVDRSGGGLLTPGGRTTSGGGRVAAPAAERSAFPDQVTLVDRDGSLLGHMDVRAENVTYGILQTEGVV